MPLPARRSESHIERRRATVVIFLRLEVTSVVILWRGHETVFILAQLEKTWKLSRKKEEKRISSSLFENDMRAPLEKGDERVVFLLSWKRRRDLFFQIELRWSSSSLVEWKHESSLSSEMVFIFSLGKVSFRKVKCDGHHLHSFFPEKTFISKTCDSRPPLWIKEAVWL